MVRMTVVSFIFGMVVALSAQTVDINGTVTNKTSGKPVAGAVIALPSYKLTATTNAQGAFSLTGGVFVVNPSPILPSTERISFNSRIVTLTLTKPSPVKIELYDMMGNLLGRVIDHPASSGEYRFDLMNHPQAAKMMVIRVTIGEHASSFRCLPLNNGSRTSGSSGAAASISGKLAKMQAAVDSLTVTAANYISRVVPLNSYQETVTISLDSNTAGLDRFSFFVTSLAGLQRLSGSEKGFGGDFRFGKTGQGAGLLGADSICQCLAEASMPGSKVKQWRAFLSVHQGPDGKPINARDRIGQGPWYDRVGRLVANNLNDLLQQRPNGDAEIKNDLPNEDGIPNHQPDPAKAAVDNHLTVTGSDSLGRLYTGPTNNFGRGGGWGGTTRDTTGSDTANSTCEDWTTNTSATGSKPRCGVSWPASFGTFGGGGTGGTGETGGMGGMMMNGMTSWISVWSLSGCEPGVDLEMSTGAGLPNVYTIGNGGGYGGFYCFALNP